ncbi:unnamed protein product [Oikopleura dioica]|uniref:L-xylulose reductase n=1 Tax=Oikopleura dioica TaxID=34765 RepID=E4XJD1_OIKDI|nr:unnamed protein product [Oikopleura dioica]
MDFSGKKIVVTGAGKGIGRGISIELAELGATVFAVSRTQSDLDSLKLEIGENLIPIQCDVSSWSDIDQKLGAIEGIDGLVNNAAVAICRPFLEATESDFDTQMNINVKGAMHVAQVIAKDMAKRRRGSIVNISSQASQAALADHVVYGMTKASLDMLTKIMALELGPLGIRTNAVNPTVVMTAMAKVGWSDPAKAGPMLAKIPLGRFAEVDDVVGPVLYLLSDLSAMVNGVTHPIDGGFLAQ